MPQTSSAKKLTFAGRNAHNLATAKRLALQYLTTLVAFMRHENGELEVSSVSLSITELRELLGSWNSGFPSTNRLLSMGRQLEDAASDLGDHPSCPG